MKLFFKNMLLKAINWDTLFSLCWIKTAKPYMYRKVGVWKKERGMMKIKC